ncbi:G-protein coupled receptor moody-like, partial [Musca vetustissima]|uniref:G-protein coupled receptor moody-like n=1 Tax=Musca vetustissima TaxID=27455 RepID=UPI002AB601DF
YVMIAHHNSYGKIYKRHWIAAMIVFCWVFSYGMQLPTLVGAWGTFGYDPKLGTCSIREDDHGHSISTDVKQESVQKQPTTRIKDQREVRAKRNEWRITKMVLAIFLSFVVCYLPITIAKVADQDVEHPNLHILSYIMLYLSACINPIIYVIMNKQYRKAYKTVIMCEPSRLLPFGKHGAGANGGGGSSAAEKWKDTGLSHNHSRTIVSQMSAADPPNTSCSSSAQVPAMELTPSQRSSVASDNTANMMDSTMTVPTSVSVPTSIESVNRATVKNETPQSMAPVSLHPIADIQNNNNSSGIQRNDSNTAPLRPIKEINRIALVGGDIILEEEEEDEEEEAAETQAAQALKVATPVPHTEPLVTTVVPLQAATTSSPTITTRPAPVYVNASVLHQKKNPSYGQNINVIPDNKNSNKQLLKL